ncbi:MAG: hypothetical protein M1570_05465 [Chloroflexi bacterium]|nr:hypothetical protein [Chloroflexota bacterium]
MRQFALLPYLLALASLTAIPASLLASPNEPICVDPTRPSICYTTIGEAVAAASAGDAITVASGIFHEQLSIDKELKIVGSGAGSTFIEPATSMTTVVVIEPGTRLTFSNLTLGNAAVSDLYCGGAIRNLGVLTATNVAILHSSSPVSGGAICNTSKGTMTLDNVLIDDAQAPARGGAIDNLGLAVLTHTTIRNSSTTDPADGLGGGIRNQGTMTITASTVEANAAAIGGGIYNTGKLYIADSAIQANHAVTVGGGIWNGRTLFVDRSEISENRAQVSGGGIADADAAVLTNVTISGNAAPTGAAIFVDGPGTQISYATIAGNLDGPAISRSQNASMPYFRAGLIAANLVGNCSQPVASSGHNLEDGDSCDLSPTADKLNAYAHLDSLRQNSPGTTRTMALLAGSAAIDAIPADGCTDLAGQQVATDQRGVARPVGAGCDIGAYEYQAAGPSPNPTPGPSGGTSILHLPLITR